MSVTPARNWNLDSKALGKGALGLLLVASGSYSLDYSLDRKPQLWSNISLLSILGVMLFSAGWGVTTWAIASDSKNKVTSSLAPISVWLATLMMIIVAMSSRSYRVRVIVGIIAALLLVAGWSWTAYEIATQRKEWESGHKTALAAAGAVGVVASSLLLFMSRRYRFASNTLNKDCSNVYNFANPVFALSWAMVVLGIASR